VCVICGRGPRGDFAVFGLLADGGTVRTPSSVSRGLIGYNCFTMRRFFPPPPPPSPHTLTLMALYCVYAPATGAGSHFTLNPTKMANAPDDFHDLDCGERILRHWLLQMKLLKSDMQQIPSSANVTVVMFENFTRSHVSTTVVVLRSGKFGWQRLCFVQYCRSDPWV
jgi:hypothetical protein